MSVHSSTKVYLLPLAILLTLAFTAEVLGLEQGEHASISIPSSSELTFEPAAGLGPNGLLFVSRMRKYTVFLQPNKLTMAISSPTERPHHEGKLNSIFLSLRLLGSNPSSPKPEMAIAGRSNYFIGNDPRKWRTDIPRFRRVMYPSVYEDVDLVYHGTKDHVEYDFVVRSGGNPGSIRFSVEGADQISLEKNGSLALHIGNTEFAVHRPSAYQMFRGQRREVSANFVRLDRDLFGFQVGEFDRKMPLVIDPTVLYSTYFGGSGDEGIFGIRFDKQGNIYVAGETSSLDFPTKHPAQSKVGGSYDVFVSKFDPTGKNLIYSTYLGGSQFDHAVGLQLDDHGSAYIAGLTFSSDFPVKNALQPSFAGQADGFVARLSPSGSELIFSTYLGGEGFDSINALAIDHEGSVYVTGQTRSQQFPLTSSAFQKACDGGANPNFCTGDAFFSKIDPTGTKLIYSSYLGGSGSDSAAGIAVNSHGEALIAGGTVSRDFPTRNAYQSSIKGIGAAFLAKVNVSGSGLVFSTYLGGSSFDSATDIALDEGQNIYLTGTTSSKDFPVLHAFQPQNHGGFLDAFITKFNPKGSGLIYSTYLGGSNLDYPFRIVITSRGEAVVAGFTSSTDFPVHQPLQLAYGGGQTDTFVAMLGTEGNELRFSTYLGGTSDEYTYALSLGCENSFWVGGSTASKNFPIVNAFQNTFAGGPYDAFLSHITSEAWSNSTECLK